MDVWFDRPTTLLVDALRNRFNQECDLAEATVANLWKTFPGNTDVKEVLTKVITLNSLYHTRVRDIDLERLASHIKGKNIDPLFDNESLDAVAVVCGCSELRRYFSFATKYCNWHKPNAYPIYDRYVDCCLWSYQIQDRFSKTPFRRQGLQEVTTLHRVVSAFREFYGLDLPFKEIDKFLWMQGRRIAKPVSAEVDWGPAVGAEVWWT